MEIKLVITIDEKVEKLADKILHALSLRNDAPAPQSKAPETAKETKRPETSVKPKMDATAVEKPIDPKPEPEGVLLEPESPSVSLADFISAEVGKVEPVAKTEATPSVSVTAADARVAVNKARERKVNMDTIKDLIVKKYQSKNVSAIPEAKLVAFIADVEAL